MNKPSEMPTPLTDAAQINVGSDCGQYGRYMVEPDFARQLERDLSTLRIAAEAARDAIHRAIDGYEDNSPEIHDGRAMMEITFGEFRQLSKALASLRSELAKTTPANPETPAPHPG